MTRADGQQLHRDPDPGEVARGYEAIIERFVAWANAEERIRAAAVIGSRARADHAADVWADLDIVVLATAPEQYARGADWPARLGEPWIAFVESTPGGEALERRVLFAGGLDVDFAFFDVRRAHEAAFIDVARTVISRGKRILVDKDGVLARLEATSPREPSAADAAITDAETVLQVASDFWYHAVWTAKHLRRGELWWAKGGCDGRLKELLRIALEWDARTQGRDAWFRGRFLEEWADPAAVGRLSRAFARYDEREIWRALAVTMDLFADVARRATERLGLPYPADAETRARELVGSYAGPHQGA